MPIRQTRRRLWVREAHAIFNTHGQHRADGERWGPWHGLPTTVSDDGKQIVYYREGFDRCDPGCWRPSIHMPRWACRLVLEITDVRVERLHEISDSECWAEGAIERARPDQFSVYSVIGADGKAYLSPRGAFSTLWNSTGGDWASNSWVWVIEFKRAEGEGNG